jgi:hypothetical protein
MIDISTIFIMWGVVKMGSTLHILSLINYAITSKLKFENKKLLI